MTNAEFITQMERLARVFGERAYPTERTRLIWEQVSWLSEVSFARIVDDFIGSSRQPPLMPEFRDAIELERARIRGQENVIPDDRPWERPHACGYCYDTGAMLCEKRGAPGVWAFRCACAIGLRDPRKHIPYFTAAHARDFVFFDVRKRAIDVQAVPVPAEALITE